MTAQKTMSPDLISQLVDPADAALPPGSNTVVTWRCPLDDRHVWQASPNVRKRSPRCPVCLNKVIIPGVNDLATTHPELAAELVDPSLTTQVHSGTHKTLAWTCGREGHQWKASVVSRSRLNAGCPFCSGRRPVPGVNDLATTHPELAAELSDPAQARSVGAGSTKKLIWKCVKHDKPFTWNAPVRQRTRQPSPSGCPACASREHRTYERRQTIAEAHPRLLTLMVHPETDGQRTLGSDVQIRWVCNKTTTPHTYTMNARRRVRGHGCPVCAGKQVVPGVNDLTTTHPELTAQLANPTLGRQLTKGSEKTPLWICAQGHEWNAAVYARVAGNECPECSPVGSSFGEQQLFDAVCALKGDALSRAVLPQRDRRDVEIDIIAEPLAIEFNGLYWHSSAVNPDEDRHARKIAAIREADLESFTVWEDEWADPVRRGITLTAIAYRLHALEHLPEAFERAGLGSPDPLLCEQVGARALTPLWISNADASAFFEAHHIQGSTALTRSFALVDDQGIARAVLGLRSPDHNARSRRQKGQWEIQRYATRGVIPGGFTRLLAHAQKILLAEGVNLRSWVTLSADQSTTGKLYSAAGFSPAGTVPSNYWYTGGIARDRRASKEAFQKKRFREDPALLWDESWTEREAAAANGLHRVWDAGKTRWVKTIG